MERAYLRFSAAVVVPKTTIIACAFINACNQLGLVGDFYVTSGNDRVHAHNSAHYTDEALDFRTKTMTTAQKHALCVALRIRLGGSYTVILEQEGQMNEHLHVQVRRDLRAQRGEDGTS